MSAAIPLAAAMTATSDLVLLGRVTLSLLVVLTVAVLAARLARRAGGGAGAGSVRMRARLGLTREASLAVVEIGDRALVLGVTPSSVRLLTTLDAAALGGDPLLTEPPAADATRPTVRQLLETLRDRTARRR